MPNLTPSDLLTVDLTKVKRRISSSPSVKSPLYDGEQMYDWLNDNSNISYCWVVSYTVSPFHELNKPIARLIYCLGTCTGVPQKKKFADIHTKLFIGFDTLAKPIAAFVGSQNLVAPTSHNLNVLLIGKSVLPCVDYFTHLWTKA